MLKTLRIYIFSFLVLVAPLVLTASALAQTNLGSGPTGAGTQLPVTGDVDKAACSGKTLCNPLKVGTLPELLKLVLEAVVYIGSIILTLAIIWVGFKFVAAQGNPEKIKEARNALVWTLIGGLILLGAQAISLAIQSTVGSLQAQ